MAADDPRTGSGSGADAGSSAGAGDGTTVAPSRRRLLTYAAVVAPLVVGLAAAAGAGARLIDGRAEWPAQLVVAGVLVIAAGGVLHRLAVRAGRGGPS